MTITSLTNPRVKGLVALRRRRVRDAEGVTLVEGHEELALALAAGVAPRALYVCPELYSPSGYAGSQAIGRQQDLVTAARSAGAEVVAVSRAVFEKVSLREGPDGLLGVLPRIDRGLAELTLPADPLLLIAEGVEKPGNLGAMLRTADAAGADAVLAADPVTDWGNPNVVRASKGTVFAVPVASAGSEELIAWCRQRGIRLVVTTPETPVRHTDISYAGPTALIVGAEKLGASPAMLAAADETVRIPMRGKTNSLNVAAAAAVVLFEVVRQRDLLGAASDGEPKT
jgi:TrmH family RNA methyltransferase